MDWFFDIKECCGCGACEQVCPTKCITMTANHEGFLFPAKNADKCIHCKKCEKVCPVTNKFQTDAVRKDCFMCRTKDEQLLSNSSSGGVFTTLAERVIDDGGMVVGAIYDDSWNVVLAETSDKSFLARMRGSKYVASTVGKIYLEVKEALVNERLVLFTGTPCQVAGLKHFLGQEFDKLIAVDIMCHGVPSPKVWRKYLQEIGSHKKIASISFRSKAFGWNRYALKVDSVENCILHEPNDVNIYMQGFLNGLYNRISCGNCPSRGFNNGSDITIGDYWELEKCNPKDFDNKGMSLIIVNTNKGLEWVGRIKTDLAIVPVDWQSIKTSGCHGTLLGSACAHDGRTYFFRHFDLATNVSKLIYKSLKYKRPLSVKGMCVKILKSLFGKRYYQVSRIWNER